MNRKKNLRLVFRPSVRAVVTVNISDSSINSDSDSDVNDEYKIDYLPATTTTTIVFGMRYDKCDRFWRWKDDAKRPQADPSCKSR